MKRIVIVGVSLLVFAVDTLRRAFRSVVGARTPATVVVLAYHSVAPEKRSAFARQMDKLVRCAKPRRADARLPQSVGDRYVSVTFDDGYQNLLDNAIPELAQRNIPATIFVVSGALGVAPNWEDYSGGTDCALTEPIFTVEQLRKLPCDLIQIGSHTVRHPKLPLLREDEARSELSMSRVMLEETLGTEVKLFSFPYSAFDANLIEWCHDAGYERVFITHPHTLPTEREEFAVGRITADPEDWPLEFHLKLHGAYRWRNRWRLRVWPAALHSVLPVRDEP